MTGDATKAAPGLITASGRRYLPTQQRHDDWQAWTDLLDAAGVRHVRLHDARHAAATVLMGMDVYQLVAADILPRLEA